MKTPPNPGEVRARGTGLGVSDLETIYDEYGDRVFRFLYGMTGETEMASDLVQETFLKLHQADKPEPGETPGAPLIFTVARNSAISRLRRRKLEERHMSTLPPEKLDALRGSTRAHDPSARVERAELHHALVRALSEVPELMRTTFLLSELEGLSYASRGEVMNCSPGTVASRKHHATRHLREHLRREGFGL